MTELISLPAWADRSDSGSTFTRIVSQHLPNAIDVAPGLICGGLPDGESAFEELASRGIKTVISVDGAKPDVESAQRFGLRYVHLPHGYDGVPTIRALELAKAVEELEGPIYIHCHHGKHRSPAATAVACIATGRMTNAQGKLLLDLAGTHPNYRGLWESVAKADVIPKEKLAEMKADFPEAAEINPLAKAMVALDGRFERLRERHDVGWKDADPEGLAELVLLIKEDYAEMLRLDEIKRFPAGLTIELREAWRQAKALEETLRDSKSKEVPMDSMKEDFDRSFRALRDGCKRCHAGFRDNAGNS